MSSPAPILVHLLAGAGDSAATIRGSVFDLMVILGTATIVAVGLQRIRLAVIPAYLIAGALIGPSALRLVRSPESLASISSLAIILLMFGVGLHLHLSALGRGLWRMILTGACSCALTIVALAPLAKLLGVSWAAALAVAMALSVSSTAVVLRLIAERGELKHTSGRLAIAILVVQDMLVIPMLAAIPLLAEIAHSGEQGASLTEVARDWHWPTALGKTALRLMGVALLVAAGRLLLPWLLREAAREKSGEIMMIASLAAAITAAVAAHALGFSPELGAFLAGFVLATTPFRHQLSGQIAPLRDLFMAVFFTTLGMRIDVAILADHWPSIVIGGALMTAIKALIIGGSAWALGSMPAAAVAVGCALAQGGEFGLILIGAAEQSGVVNDITVMNATAVIVISLMLTPALVDLGRRWSKRWAGAPVAPWFASKGTPPSETQKENHFPGEFAIVGGYGQVGRRVVEHLARAGLGAVVVELNPAAVEAGEKMSPRFVFGDVSNAEVLDTAEIAKSRALILTMPDEHSVLRACAIARRTQANIFIVARINFASHRRMAEELGADAVIVEELETADAMSRAIAERFDQEIPGARARHADHQPLKTIE